MGLPLLLSLALAVAPEGCLAARVRGKKAEPLGAFDTSCYMVDDKGESYRGLVTSTLSGRTCQKWTAQKPWEITLTLSTDNGLGNHNYCRNPDGSQEMPWCYTMDTSEEHKIETCSIPECPEEERDFADEAATLATAIESKDCECADQLYGSSKTTADTSVALNQGNKTVAKHGKCRCARKARKASAISVGNTTDAKRVRNTTGAKTPVYVCLASHLFTKTHTDTGSGVTDWQPSSAAPDTCHDADGTAGFRLCGPATLEAFTGSNCDGTSETVVHAVGSTTAADCSDIPKPSGGYWNSFKYVCGAGNER